MEKELENLDEPVFDTYEVKKINDSYLELFSKDLHSTTLKENTIQRHLSNIDFFINQYLLNWQEQTIQEGIYSLGDFFGNFFIRKCMWSTPGSIRSYTGSVRRFYKCLLQNGIVSKDEFDIVNSIIKCDLSFWMERCEEYNDPQHSFNPFMFL